LGDDLVGGRPVEVDVGDAKVNSLRTEPLKQRGPEEVAVTTSAGRSPPS
jgi:hypothetical protein